MKQIYSFLFLLLFSAANAQAPAAYYNNATGSGYALKTQLYNIIKDHTVNDYAGLYVILRTRQVQIPTITLSHLRKDVGITTMKVTVTTENTSYHNLYLIRNPQWFLMLISSYLLTEK
jgi:hypothetical protein